MAVGEAYYPGITAGDAAAILPDGSVETVIVPPNSFFQVFELADTANATPLVVRTESGLTDTKVPVGALPILPDVYVVSPNFAHRWVSGDLKFRRDSNDAKDKAVADAVAAAQGALAAVPQRVSAEVQSVAATGAFKGEPGKDGANVVTTRDAVAGELQDPNSPSRAVLSATIAVAVAPLATLAEVDAVAALVNSGGNVIVSSDVTKVLAPGQVQLVVAPTPPTSIMDFGQPVIWFDAQKHTEADAAPVNSLRDYSGYVNNGALNAGATSPVMATAGINGRKAISLASASQFTSTFIASESGEMTVIFVGQVNTPPASLGYTLCDGITGAGDRLAVTVSDTLAIQLSRATLQSAPAGTMLTVPCVLAASFRADGSATVWVNGTKTAVPASLGTSIITGIQFGGRFNGINRVTGKLGNFGVLPKSLTDTEASALTSMLKTYWGIA